MSRKPKGKHFPRIKLRKKYKKQPGLRVIRLVQGLISGLNNSEAAIAAGYSPKNPAVSAYNALQALAKNTPEILADNGLTLDSVLKKHLIPLLHATQIKVFQHHGVAKSAVEVADNVVRKDATDMVIRLLGAYAPLKVEQENKQKISCIVLDVPRPKRDIPPPTMVRLANPVNPAEPAADGTKKNQE